MNEALRKNQLDAINISISNNFSSGIHNHATGSGKSWIALQILLEYQKINNNCNVLWICERKSILQQQFNRKCLSERGYGNVNKIFHILDYSNYKNKEWYDCVNSSPFWGKPTLVIINRAFLVSSNKYKLIKIPINLIIHDECHSIVNKTTQEFYRYIRETSPNTKCLGFTATPILTINPYDKLLSHYSIYDAVRDKVIVPPKIKWFKSNEVLDIHTLILTIKDVISDLPYKKIVIWSGMIDYCKQLVLQWKYYFPDFNICLDTSQDSKLEGIGDFTDFNNLNKNAILFCACKHREGSDIKNLDAAVFLDGVANRCPQVFVQCVGRVLRKDSDNKKKFGLIIDFKASSSIKICDRMGKYFQLPQKEFPWKHTVVSKIVKNKSLKIHTLEIDFNKDSLNLNQDLDLNTNNCDIDKLFIRSCPNIPIYQERLNLELNLIKTKKLEPYILHAMKILEFTKTIPHVTRGSCGSSLVCYLLGISHTDPIKYNISFARFLNEYRDTLPDIDFDFPYNLRDEVFMKIQKKWPGCVARISNHVYYHEKSALREAVRRAGIRKFISKHDLHKTIKSLPQDTQSFIKDECSRIKEKFKCYSLHCGGIVYYPEGVPDEIKLEGKQKSLSQVIYNKKDVSKEGKFKIDILSSRALTQLHEIKDYKDIDFNSNDYDEKTSSLLSNGDNIGITLAESPLMRRAFLKIKPKCIKDVAICLAIIRPFASDILHNDNFDNLDEEMIFDDDAIRLIRDTIDCSEADADRYRRAYGKRKQKLMEELERKLSRLSQSKGEILVSKLNNLRKYSFCKSHSYSYAQLVWQLAYCKCHFPEKFWKSTLNHVKSNYRKWVHLYEAHLNDVDFSSKGLTRNNKSIYSQNKSKKPINSNISAIEMLKIKGYWNFNNKLFFPNCYFIKNRDKVKFRGIIASCRNSKKKKNISLGVNNNHYINLCLLNYNGIIDSKFVGVKGEGIWDSKENITTCEIFHLF